MYTSQVPLERIEMFGGKVSLTQSLEDSSFTLHLTDRRGHRHALRCGDNEAAAARWEAAVRAHIHQDFAKTFVTPSRLPREPSLYRDVLVIDVGGSSVRAGVATAFPTLPRVFFPSAMAQEHHNEQAR